MKSKIIWFIPGIVVTLGIFLLSTILSSPFQIEGIEYQDKISHCFAYFVLVLSFMLGLKKVGLLNHRRSILLILAASLYGLGLELIQFTFFPNRYFEWIDALADVVGAVIGYLLFKLMDRA